MAVVGLVTLLVAQTYSVILFLSQKYCEAMTKSLWLEASVSRSMWHIPYVYCHMISLVRITYQSGTADYTLLYNYTRAGHHSFVP